jgi:phosphopantetheinyl transferase
MHAILLHHCTVPRDLDAGLLGRWMALLPEDQSARVARLRDPSARAASLLGIALLDHCAREAGIAPPLPGALRFPPGGKPDWPSGRDFSISHAGQHVACAMAPPGVQVGLDIEPAGAAERAGLRLVADEAEKEGISAAGLTATDLWTAKEAVAKLTGAGLAAVASIFVAGESARHDGCDYPLARPRLAPGLCCTVAMSTALPVALREVPAERLLP